jgi:hypothetical protein
MEYIKIWIVFWVIVAYIAACFFVPGTEGKWLCFYAGVVSGAWAVMNAPPRQTREDLRKLRFK